MTPRQVRKFCALKPEAMAILKAAMEDLGLSARAHDKVLRVARTIADLEGQRRHQAAAHRRGGRLSVARSERVGVRWPLEVAIRQLTGTGSRRSSRSGSSMSHAGPTYIAYLYYLPYTEIRATFRCMPPGRRGRQRSLLPGIHFIGIRMIIRMRWCIGTVTALALLLGSQVDVRSQEATGPDSSGEKVDAFRRAGAGAASGRPSCRAGWATSRSIRSSGAPGTSRRRPGGVWKTTNSGTTWTPIFDGYGSYSIGCVAVDPRNHLVVWVGTGENNSQRSVGYGDGLYKSIDGGASFSKVGLERSEHIAKVLIDPRNSKVVYVAAQGPLWNAGRRSGAVQDHRRRQDLEGRACRSARTPA